MSTPKVCVVTLTLGEKRYHYERLFLPSIKAFAQKHNYDFKQLTEFLDPPTYDRDSLLIVKHTFCVQKLLVAQQPWINDYDWIVIIDADILINYENTPNLVDQLVPGKICVVSDRHLFGNKDIVTFFWKNTNNNGHPSTAEEYYPYLNFPETFDNQCNSGFVCFQPKHHKKFFKELYDNYAPRIYAGEDIDGDQGPLNYEGNRQKLLHYLDERWNRIWLFPRGLFYTFLDSFYNKEELQKAFNSIFNLSYCIHMTGNCDWDLLE